MARCRSASDHVETAPGAGIQTGDGRCRRLGGGMIKREQRQLAAAALSRRRAEAAGAVQHRCRHCMPVDPEPGASRRAVAASQHGGTVGPPSRRRIPRTVQPFIAVGSERYRPGMARPDQDDDGAQIVSRPSAAVPPRRRRGRRCGRVRERAAWRPWRGPAPSPTRGKPAPDQPPGSRGSCARRAGRAGPRYPSRRAARSGKHPPRRMPARVSTRSTSPECTTPPSASRLACIRSGYTVSRSIMPASRASAKSSAIEASGAITRSTDEWLMSRSCHSATSSSAGTHGGADHPRQAGEIFRQHRVALVRHGRGAFLAGMEEFLGLAHFAALQVAYLGGQPLDPAGNHRQRTEPGGMAVARDDLSGDRFHRQAELVGDEFLHTRVDMREGADRAADRCHRDLLPRRHQPPPVALEFRVMSGEFQSERGGLGMDAVAAADGERVLVFERACLERRQHSHRGRAAAGRWPAQAARTGRCPARPTTSCPDARSGCPARSPRRARSGTRSRHAASRVRSRRCGRGRLG